MHANHNLRTAQQRLVKKHTRNSDAYAFFNLLTSEHLLDTVESLLPTIKGASVNCFAEKNADPFYLRDCAEGEQAEAED